MSSQTHFKMNLYVMPEASDSMCLVEALWMETNLDYNILIQITSSNTLEYRV